MTTWHPPVLFEERLRPAARAWWWLAVICVVTLFTLGAIAVPIAVLAWLVNIARFARVRTRVDEERIWVGRRSVRLAALDLSTLGRATNPWPWRVLSPRYLGGNPIWTRDSLGVRGRDGKRKCWVAVGTNRRDELVGLLERLVPAARARAEASASAYAGLALPPAGWYDDPHDPDRIRWWDGQAWTAYVAPRPAPSRTTP